MALATGMRRDEIRLLTWDQIDFDRKQITVGVSKTAGKGRMIPFGAMLESVLAGYRDWYVGKLGKIDPTHYVFPLSNRTKPIDATESDPDLSKVHGSPFATRQA